MMIEIFLSLRFGHIAETQSAEYTHGLTKNRSVRLSQTGESKSALSSLT